MSGLFDRIVQRTKRPLVTAIATIGGGYLIINYLKSKLNEIQHSLTQNRICTENLRRRFEQNQEDCSFTVSALIPTLGKQILESMNVERLAEVLSQTKSQNRQVTAPGSEAESKQEPERLNLLNGSSGTSEETPHINNNSIVDDSVSSLLEIPNGDQKETIKTPQPELTPTTPDSSTQTTTEALFRPDGSKLQKRSEIWKEMMILSFSRLFTCLYGLTLLTLQTHIQLGLLGRESYLSSIVSFENNQSENQDYDENQVEIVKNEEFESQMILDYREFLDVVTERRYLTFSWWYLHKGWKILSQKIRRSVEEVLGSKSLKELVTFTDLRVILDDIRTKVESEVDGSDYSFSSILLPTDPVDEIETLKLGGMKLEDCKIDDRLRKLLDETKDLLDCLDFKEVLKSSMDRILKNCLDHLGINSSLVDEKFNQQDRTNQLIHPRFREISSDDQEEEEKSKNSRSLRLVEILPMISKQSQSILNSIPNEYTEILSETIELREFSTVIYTTFDSLIDKI